MEDLSGSPHSQSAYEETLLINSAQQQDEELQLGRDHGYRVEKIIGRGSFGAAFLARDAQSSQRVIKAVEVQRAKPPSSAHAEVVVMKGLRHPHIIRFRESFVEKHLLCIVMDYAPAGDLLLRVDAARRAAETLPEEQTLQWFLQALAGVKYMHSLCVIHRDLKNENLFLESEAHLRIGDFGLARRLKRVSEIFVEQQIVGTPLYLSPEVCAKGMYSTASDVWALGCSLFELTSLSLPFEAVNLPSLLVKITSMTTAPRPSGPCSQELADICAWLLTKSRQSRPAAVEVFQHPFLRSMADEALRRRPKIEAKAAEPVGTRESEAATGGYPKRAEADGLASRARVAFGAVGPAAAEPSDTPTQADRQPSAARAKLRPRSLSPEACYEQHLALSQSLGGAAGSPQQWLRSLRKSKSGKVRPLDAAEDAGRAAGGASTRPQPALARCGSVAGSPHQLLRSLRKSKSEQAKTAEAAEDEASESVGRQITLRLAPGAEDAQDNDNTFAILQAEVLPQHAQLVAAGGSQAPSKCVLRSKSSSALETRTASLEPYRKKPYAVQPPPLKLGKLHLSGIRTPSARQEKESARRLDSARRAKSARALPSERPPSRAVSKEARRPSREPRRHPLRAALRGAAAPAREAKGAARPRSLQRPRATPKAVRPLLLQESPRAEETPRPLPRSPSAPPAPRPGRSSKKAPPSAGRRRGGGGGTGKTPRGAPSPAVELVEFADCDKEG